MYTSLQSKECKLELQETLYWCKSKIGLTFTGSRSKQSRRDDHDHYTDYRDHGSVYNGSI